MYCVTYNNGPAEFDLSSHPRVNGIDRELPCMEDKDLSHFPNQGNPNGFKLGGQGNDNKASGNYARHDTQLTNCLAVGHRKKGFDQNNNAGRMAISHCLAYRNGVNFGFGNPYPCTLDIRYCTSVEPLEGEHFTTSAECSITQDYNSWNDNNKVNTTILESTDIVQAVRAERQPDGALPTALLKIMETF